MNRFLWSVGVCLVVAGLSYAAEPAKPNILFAMADDWSWPHASIYGDKVIRTPTFDRVAREGILFRHCFSVTPSCTPSRAAVLTGQATHRLEESGNLHSILRKKFDTYPDLLEAAGYHVGVTRKGWGPGKLEGSGRMRNPAGPDYKDFESFLKSVPDGKPFCFWFGSHDPHRAYVKGSGIKSGMNPADVFVPPYLPDTPEVRSDICDYYFAAQRYDRDVGALLDLLAKSGKLDNTIVLMTGDNGWPFPRGKANVYDSGSRQPLAICWPARVKGGQKSEAFISFQDFAPTFLEAAGLKVPTSMTGRSFLDLLTGDSRVVRDRVYLERERHAYCRKGNLGYPSRAVRTKDFLYIRNFHPERWPDGDPEYVFSQGPHGDTDESPTKYVIIGGKDDPKIGPLYQLAFGKRPAEELYDLAKDPYQMMNVAERPGYAEAKKKLRADLDRWMRDTDDPRARGEDDRWDRYPYTGPPARKKN